MSRCRYTLMEYERIFRMGRRIGKSLRMAEAVSQFIELAPFKPLRNAPRFTAVCAILESGSVVGVVTAHAHHAQPR